MTEGHDVQVTTSATVQLARETSRRHVSSSRHCGVLPDDVFLRQVVESDALAHISVSHMWRHCENGLDSGQGGDVSASLVVGVSSVDVFRACCRIAIRGRLNSLDVLCFALVSAQTRSKRLKRKNHQR